MYAPLWLHKFSTWGCHSATNYINVPIFTPTSRTAVVMFRELPFCCAFYSWSKMSSNKIFSWSLLILQTHPTFLPLTSVCYQRWVIHRHLTKSCTEVNTPQKKSPQNISEFHMNIGNVNIALKSEQDL